MWSPLGAAPAAALSLHQLHLHGMSRIALILGKGLQKGPGPVPVPASPCCVPRCQRRAVPHAVSSRLPRDAPRQLQHRPADALPVAGKAVVGGPVGLLGSVSLALPPLILPWSVVTSYYLPSQAGCHPHCTPQYQLKDGSVYHWGPNPPPLAVGLMGWRFFPVQERSQRKHQHKFNSSQSSWPRLAPTCVSPGTARCGSTQAGSMPEPVPPQHSLSLQLPEHAHF